MRQRLRLYTEQNDAMVAAAEPDVSVTVSEITEILSHAKRCNRAWLKDFADDRVQISADLYEVLRAYWELRPGA